MLWLGLDIELHGGLGGTKYWVAGRGFGLCSLRLCVISETLQSLFLDVRACRQPVARIMQTPSKRIELQGALVAPKYWVAGGVSGPCSLGEWGSYNARGRAPHDAIYSDI